jgi:hypothetical protein
MRQKYIDKNFGAEALKMIGTINGILREYAESGYDLSLRQAFYQLVARGIIPNTERSYKNTGNLVSDARLAGLMDWDMIKDRGRTVVNNNHWNSPAEIIDACARQFRVDRWENQPCRVICMVEKQALEGVLLPVCRELDISFSANKGYSSSSALREIGLVIKEWLEGGSEVHVIYLGDHDPSGIDMTRDVLERLRQFSEADQDDNLVMDVHRVALNMDQVEELNPPQNPAKLTDSRAAEYIRRFGDKSWELDAIEPKALARLVTDAVLELRDEDLWERSGREQQRGRDYLSKMSRDYTPEEDDES